MNIEQCIERSKQIPRTQHEQGYIDAICWLLRELEKRPVVVEQNADANTMNELHGEAYGVDWVYPAPSAQDAFPQAHRLALELECLILSCKDNAAVSKWWDSANEALEQWREFNDAARSGE